MRIIGSLALILAIVLGVRPAAAERMQLVHPRVVCVPSGDQESGEVTPSRRLCLLRLAPWFEHTSFELTPQATITRNVAMKRLGAELELRF